MKRLLLALALLIPATAFGQAWSGVLTAPRAVDWSGVGVTGGIPTTRTRCTTGTGTSILPTSSTAAQISTAISGCDAGHFVELATGTFASITDSIAHGKDNVTLKGQGAGSTLLIIPNTFVDASTGCHIGDNRVIEVCKGAGNIGSDGNGDNSTTWSAGYTQGTTVITLASTANLYVGAAIFLDQLDSTVDYPATGDIKYTTWGSNPYSRASRSQVEVHIVSNISGGSVTITPGVLMPEFRAGQTPQAWWATSTNMLTGAGLEDMTIDDTAAGVNGIYFVNCTNCYMTRVRKVYNGTLTGNYRGFTCINCPNFSATDNYFYGPLATDLTDKYGIAFSVMSNSLIQNNIIHASVNPLVLNSSATGNAVTYNYFNNTGLSSSYSQSSIIQHAHADMNLFEGNDGARWSSDNIHTPHYFDTLFRNHWNGQAFNPGAGETQAAFAVYAWSHFMNLVGNVVGNSEWNTYANGQSPPAQCQTCIYEFGWDGTGSYYSPTGYGTDAYAGTSAMRWGNWDSITSTNDNGSNDSTGTRFVNAEVPSGITNYPNSIPASQTLPASFIYSSQPSTWWGTPYGTVPWPPIGPDVSSGTINSGSTEPTGGHANKIPARLCFENATNDSGYGSSSPRVLNFTATTCYTSSSDVTNPTVGSSGVLAVTAFGTSTVSLLWAKATDDTSAQNTLQYEVRRSSSQNMTTVATAEANGTIAQAYSTDIATAALTGLTPKTNYYFTIIVKDQAGNKAIYTTSIRVQTRRLGGIFRKPEKDELN